MRALRPLLMFVAVHAMTNARANAEPMTEAHLGRVHFPISCASAQGKFDQAMTLLHNFFYPETVKAFQALTQEYPTCAIGYWGLAMSERPNPLVPPFPVANLKAGWEAVERGKNARDHTPREAEYLGAMEVFYRDYDNIDQPTRTKLYKDAMRRLHEHYPYDSEAAIFYALALNEAVDLTDKTFANQLTAAAILRAEARKQPDHPGIAHYLIHSYDFAPLAMKGLPYAHQYDRIASASPHALHMPSHTYSMLGMWEESIRANQAAVRAANDYATRNFPEASDPSLPHLLDFLVYADLQLGRDKDAKRIIDELPRLKKFASIRLTVDTALAAMPARYALERGRWDEAARLSIRESQYPAAQSISYFARALGQARSGHPVAARAEIAHLNAIAEKLIASKEGYWAGQSRVQVLAAEGWVLFEEGQRDLAIARMQLAAELDDASEKNVAMENKLVPMRALLAELYSAAGMNREALREFDASLKSSPNRFRSLAGAAQAAHKAGLAESEKHFCYALVHLARTGDGDRPEVADAEEFLSRK